MHLCESWETGSYSVEELRFQLYTRETELSCREAQWEFLGL
jgi:hypothetical protein